MDWQRVMKPVMVGIVGGSGSGKTTLATGLAALTVPYGSRVISQDHYYRGVPQGISAESYNFDEPAALDLELLADHLRTLRRGHAIGMPRYDFATHGRLEEEEWVDPAPLIVVEGLFLFVTESLRNVFDLRFFVDVPAAERLRRRVRRDTAERGRSEGDVVRQFHEQVEPMYERHVLPTRRHAHYVLDLPHPDDRLYCEQVVEFWRRVELALRAGGEPQAVKGEVSV